MADESDKLPHPPSDSNSSDDDLRARSNDPKRYLRQRRRGPGMPRLWNEVDPNDPLIQGGENSPNVVQGQRSEEPELEHLHMLPQGLIPFAPYVEKETWLPTAWANMKLDGRGINMSILRKWMMVCTKLHGHRCDWQHAGAGLEATGPKFLIDVDNMNLVQPEPGSRYVALSYIWGAVPSCHTTTENLSTFLEKDSFRRPTVAMPQVIHEAMELVHALGEKYLWIDRFCILQDDGPEKQLQLNAMGSIYAGAWLTIFAAQNADASQGLYGTRRVFNTVKGFPSRLASTQKLKSNAAKEWLTNEKLILRNARTLMCTQWYSRGWTFQENLFSSRRILFHDDSVGWECQHASWHEAQDLSGLLDSDIPFLEHEPVGLKKMVLSPWPDMFRYARLVSLYNRRALTYPEDISDAFRGILLLLGRSYTGGIISGLPEMFFNSALLWQPWFPMTRRHPKRQSNEDAVLPSWSWMGWSGDMGSESWTTAYSYMRPTPGRGVSGGNISSWRTISTVEWYYSETFGGKRERIVDSSQEYRELVKKPNELPQKGWARYRDNRGNIFYRHQTDPTRDFWYPIPIMAAPQASNSLINARFIHGRTRSAVFSVGQHFSSQSSNCDAVDLISAQDGRWAGFLRLSLGRYDQSRVRTKTCELVELSAGYLGAATNGALIFDEWERPECPRVEYKFYNVICVKWKGPPGSRIAFRRALGRVEKSRWDAVATEIDLTLG